MAAAAVRAVMPGPARPRAVLWGCRFLATQKMSHKINPEVLMELFGDEPDADDEDG